ncbi:BrnA antitoxin family protein [Sphingobium scionense]
MRNSIGPSCAWPEKSSAPPMARSPSPVPKSDQPKQQVTLRLDQAVLDAFRATGPGWQSRINAQLRKALGL